MPTDPREAPASAPAPGQQAPADAPARPLGRRLGLAALIVSAGVLLSRLLGFVREMVLAYVLGADAATDAYNIAFLIPDFINYLLAGGYLSITFIPILSRYRAAGDEAGAWRAFASVFRALGLAVTGLTVIAMLAAEPVLRRLAPGFGPAELALAVRLTRIVLPAQIFFVLGTLLMAVQYARERFLVPTLAPLVYNLGIIAGGVLLGAVAGLAVEGFAWGVLAGAFVGNFAVQWFGARRAGMQLPAGSWRHPALREYLLLALPLMVGQSIVVIDEWLGKVFGSMAGEGAISQLNYARRVMQVPVGVLAQAAGVAAYPFLARLHAEGRHRELAATLGGALRYVVFVSLLAAAGLLALAGPTVRVAFQRGQFTEPDTLYTASALALFALAVPAWGMQQIVARGFYARREMWLPVAVGTGATVVAVPLYWGLLEWLGFRGLALAGTASMLLYTLALAVVWHLRVGREAAEPASVGLGRAWRALAVAGAGWAAARATAAAVEAWVAPLSSFEGALLALVLGGVALVAAAALVGRLVGAHEVMAVGARLLRRRRRVSAGP